MFKTIMLATDGSETAEGALACAKTLALETGAALHVVHADEKLGGRLGFVSALADEPELERRIVGRVHELKGAGIDASFDLVRGTHGPARLLADKAREIGADLIVVGTRGHRPFAGVVVGSVTQHLLHDAPCAVLAIPPDVAKQFAPAAAKAETTVSG